MTVATTRFSGRAFSEQEMTLVRGIVRDCSGLSRMELARTVCELLRWRRPNGRLKARECREFLERLDADGGLVLPAKRRGRALGSVTRVPRTAAGEPGLPLVGSVRDVEPLEVELVREPAQRLLFRELVGRYHYLGHTVPFGAHLRYLVFASRPRRAVVGGRIPDFPVTRSHPPASWPSAANSSICRTYRKTAGEESRRRSPVANRWMRP